jgi:hypothetical protein
MSNVEGRNSIDLKKNRLKGKQGMTEEKEDKTNDLKEVRAKRFHPSKFCGSLFQLCVVSYGSRLHSRRWTAFGMRIYGKSVSFVRSNPKCDVIFE